MTAKLASAATGGATLFGLPDDRILVRAVHGSLVSSATLMSETTTCRMNARKVRARKLADLVPGGVTASTKYVRMPQPMDDLRKKLKELLIERLKFEDMTPDDIKDDDPLFAGGLGLDSIDALEIVVMLETEFGIRVKNESAARDNFYSISSLADFVSHRIADQERAQV